MAKGYRKSGAGRQRIWGERGGNIMQRLAADLVCLMAPNPGLLTGPGTNTYILGTAVLTIIDPGPDDPRHLAALLALIGGRPVSHVLVTHAHRDHSALAPALARATGAPVCAFGRAGAGRSTTMARLAAQGLADDGEGLDHTHSPAIALRDGQVLDTAAGPLRILHIPGHLGDHLAFGRGDAVFVGDTVMAWSSTVVSPPDGDMGQYMASLDRLTGAGAAVLYPGHGGPVTDPAARIAALAAHRRAREAAILAGLRQGPATIAALTALVYRDTDAGLWPAAGRNVLAHLIDLSDRSRIKADPVIGPDTVFALI